MNDDRLINHGCSYCTGIHVIYSFWATWNFDGQEDVRIRIAHEACTVFVRHFRLNDF